jgi:hypothetical protein
MGGTVMAKAEGIEKIKNTVKKKKAAKLIRPKKEKLFFIKKFVLLFG